MIRSRDKVLELVTFKVDTETLRKLDKIANYKRKSRSEVIREALERYISQELNDDKFKKIKIKKVFLK